MGGILRIAEKISRSKTCRQASDRLDSSHIDPL